MLHSVIIIINTGGSIKVTLDKINVSVSKQTKVEGKKGHP